MPLGDDIYRVKAVTTNPAFLDYYGKNGPINGEYAPEIGEWGFMYETEARAAAGAGDVLLYKENTPIELERLVPAPLEAEAIVPGDGAATHIVSLEPGVLDSGYTVTVTMAIDGGGDLTAVAAGIAGDEAESVAVDLGAQVVAGVTVEYDDSGVADVFFTPDSGEFTIFTVEVTTT